MQPDPKAEALLAKHGIAYPRSGFWVHEGWHPIVDRAFERMIGAGWDRTLLQVKEKFGRLVIYVGRSNDDVDAAIRAAEDEAARTCELCGALGTLQKVESRVVTACDPCAARELAKRRR